MYTRCIWTPILTYCGVCQNGFGKVHLYEEFVILRNPLIGVLDESYRLEDRYNCHICAINLKQ